ncbi:MAG: FecR domain-containing protein [Candidatus Omnitrophica bacterium]|nr:FecR domain-containing protein [Candidatus Omnitrophota bacterium]
MRKSLAVFFVFFIFPLSLYAAALSGEYSPIAPSQGSNLNLTEDTAIKDQADLKAKITAISGDVKIRKPKSILWDKAKQNQVITKGYQIRTGYEGKAKLEVSSNIISLKPNTTLILSQASVNKFTNKYTNIFECPEGKAKFEIKDQKNLSEFQVKTPTAVAGARGTIFFLFVTSAATEALVEQGLILLRNAISGQIQTLTEGLMSRSAEDGSVSDPQVIPPEYQDELGDQSWDVQAEESQEEGETEEAQDVAEEAEETVENQDDTQEQAETDKDTSQEVEKGVFSQGPDFDGDGFPDSLDTDDDNDGLLDSFEASIGTDPKNVDSDGDDVGDGHEAWHDSDPLDTDSDNDTRSDFIDVFPQDATAWDDMTDPSVGVGVRATRYDMMDNTSGLRSEIYNMLQDNYQRQRDYIMDKICDAQRGKVLLDRLGHRVRVEQYVFRPNPTDIMIVNMNYRQSGVAYEGFTMFKFRAVFNASLDKLTPVQIRALPWDEYGSSDSNYGANKPAYYPLSMSANVTAKVGVTGYPSFEEVLTYSDVFFSSGSWQQTVDDRTITCVDSVGNVYSGGIDTINSLAHPQPDNPGGFQYIMVGHPASPINFYFTVLDDSGAKVAKDALLVYFTDFWDILVTNDESYTNIGPYNLEVHIEGGLIGTEPSDIDFIFLPLDTMFWRDDFNWDN